MSGNLKTKNKKTQKTVKVLLIEERQKKKRKSNCAFSLHLINMWAKFENCYLL